MSSPLVASSETTLPALTMLLPDAEAGEIGFCEGDACAVPGVPHEQDVRAEETRSQGSPAAGHSATEIYGTRMSSKAPG